MRKLLKKIKYLPLAFWWAEIKRTPRNISNGISNLIAWFPIIWHDRDWDWEFLNDMLIFKLSRMEQAFLSGEAYSMNAVKMAEQMAEVIDNLKELPENYPPDRMDGRPLQEEDYIAWGKKLKAHQTRAFYLMGTHIREWWD